MGKLQRRKGANGEREIVNLLKIAGIPTKRISMMETGGIDKGDILISDTWRGQVKRGGHVPIFLYKSLTDANFLFCRRDNKSWIVTMPLTELINLIKSSLDNNA